MELTRTSLRAILEGRRAVLVAFGIPALRTCRELSRHLDEIRASFGERASIVFVNVGAQTSIAAAMHIEVLPTALLFRHGQEIGRLEGARPLHHYELALSAAMEAVAVDARPLDLSLS